MTTLRGILLPALAGALVAGCAGSGMNPAAPVNAPDRPAVSPKVIAYGIGLSGFISTMVPDGLTQTTYEKTFCQNGRKIGCPVFSLGKRSYDVSLSKVSGWAMGSFSVVSSAKSDLGKFSFRHIVTSTSKSPHVFQGVEATTHYSWIDQLIVTSKSMPYGTKASFKVTTTLAPATTMVPCNADNDESVSFYFQSNGGVGAYDTIFGGCVGSKFVYYVDSPSHKGTTTVQTVRGSVGQSLSIQGMGSVVSALCQPTGCTSQSSTLEGLVKYAIVSMTPGVSFKTASGATYK